MNDSLILPFTESQSLVVSCDNSGGIGLKEKDLVQVPYEVVGYFSFRVAVMECLAAGGSPMTVVLHNFCGDEAWEALKIGVMKGMDEIGLDLSITGSTESNMPLLQSALGLMVIGKRRNERVMKPIFQRKMALIGRPLVGEEVMKQQEWIAPLSLYKSLCELEEVQVLPVGSKGIANEWKHLDPSGEGVSAHIRSKVDIEKSSGPSTCFLIAYPEHLEDEIKLQSGSFFMDE
ncbi:ATP-binding protein [Peribacillus butanolivorans]|uniref:ATP-binding protein n=1 Tax=Peribacillus butanolivorans TaxID=421767 RepID=UPI00207C9F23|nr:ATP-binding protein [Peribacillus butanolivorans]MCO0596043.1 ATP-binding protein [Peribacillus butanolivorans]